MNPSIFAALMLLPMFGCGSNPSKFEIVLQNKSDQACNITLNYALSAGAKGAQSCDGIAKGETRVLLAGSGSATVESISLKVGTMEKTLPRNVAVPNGKRFKITVAEDGAVETSTVSN